MSDVKAHFVESSSPAVRSRTQEVSEVRCKGSVERQEDRTLKSTAKPRGDGTVLGPRRHSAAGFGLHTERLSFVLSRQLPACFSRFAAMDQFCMMLLVQ